MGGDNMDGGLILSSIAQLSDRDQTILKMLNGIGCDKKTAKEVGEILGVEPNRVVHMEIRAVKRLIHCLHNETRPKIDVDYI